MNNSNRKTAIIIGAGPAGLTAAYELLKRTDIKPIVLEMSPDIGGISKTIAYKGNRIDIGGHRFFSKSDRVMRWWMELLPIQGKPSSDEICLKMDTTAKYSKTADGPDPEKVDSVMLLRNRVSRIYFLRRFFEYPVSLSIKTIKNLGIFRMVKIGLSYAWATFFPIKPIRSLEDFFVNRFGNELYRIFFKDYTEKVWGIECRKIKPEWGAQRIKGLSILKTLSHSFKKILLSRNHDFHQKQVETSLIEQFMYPKLGPGQLWEEVARQIKDMGGEIRLCTSVEKLRLEGQRIKGVTCVSSQGETTQLCGDLFFSTMPVKNLIMGIEGTISTEVREVAEGLTYRDFITVGLLLKQLKIKNETTIQTLHNLIPDNWIYIQEREVRLGRLQIFNNWSPYLVKNKENVWIGLEYFCNEGDDLWTMPDDRFIQFAIQELSRIGIINVDDVMDGTIIRVPKAYPAYFGTYEQFDKVKQFVNGIENLYLIGRNGMHRYNNSDHSMLTAMVAVDNIVQGIIAKDNIWAVNTEEEYHEEKK